VQLRTRRIRVRSFNAAVALAAAALSCGGSASTGQALRSTTTLLVGDEASRDAISLGRACVSTGLESCFNATDDDCNGLVDEGCGLPTGSLQVVIAWDAADADVDLEVTDPNGERATVGKSTVLGLTKDNNCPGEGDDCGGQNIEVVSVGGELLSPGRYRIALRLVRNSQTVECVHVRIGGHIGQDALRGQVELTRERSIISMELQRSELTARSGLD